MLSQKEIPFNLPYYKHSAEIMFHIVFMLKSTICFEVCPQNAPKEMPKDDGNFQSEQHKAELS